VLAFRFNLDKIVVVRVARTIGRVVATDLRQNIINSRDTHYFSGVIPANFAPIGHQLLAVKN
jgi:hypothetical protein